MRKSGLIVSTLIAALAVAGCAARRPASLAFSDTGRNMIFNPDGISLSRFSVLREEWPTSEGFQPSDEQVAYREVVIDRQGRHYGTHDDLYRRFYSVRTGRGRR